MKDNHHLALRTQASLLFDAHPHLENELCSFGNVIISRFVKINIHFGSENREEQLKNHPFCDICGDNYQCFNRSRPSDPSHRRGRPSNRLVIGKSCNIRLMIAISGKTCSNHRLRKPFEIIVNNIMSRVAHFEF